MMKQVDLIVEKRVKLQVMPNLFRHPTGYSDAIISAWDAETSSACHY